MASSIRLLEKIIRTNGNVSVRFSDGTNLFFPSVADYDQFVNMESLDREMVEIMRRILMCWSKKNQDAVDRQCTFDVLDSNRIIVRIRN